MNDLMIEITPQKDFHITQYEANMITAELKELLTRAKEEIEAAYQVNIKYIE